MKINRQKQISKASVQNSGNYGLILSTLGRQGSSKILENLKKKLIECNKNFVIVLMSEIFPQKLQLFSDVDVLV